MQRRFPHTHLDVCACVTVDVAHGHRPRPPGVGAGPPPPGASARHTLLRGPSGGICSVLQQVAPELAAPTAPLRSWLNAGLIGQVWGLGTCISNSFPGEAHAVGPGSRLRSQTLDLALGVWGPLQGLGPVILMAPGTRASACSPSGAYKWAAPGNQQWRRLGTRPGTRPPGALPASTAPSATDV